MIERIIFYINIYSKHCFEVKKNLVSSYLRFHLDLFVHAGEIGPHLSSSSIVYEGGQAHGGYKENRKSTVRESLKRFSRCVCMLLSDSFSFSVDVEKDNSVTIRRVLNNYS